MGGTPSARDHQAIKEIANQVRAAVTRMNSELYREDGPYNRTAELPKHPRVGTLPGRAARKPAKGGTGRDRVSVKVD